MDRTDRTTTGSRSWKQARLVRGLAAALLITLVLAATGGLGPDAAEAARTRGRSSIKLMCAQLEGSYQEYSDGSYSCHAGGWFTFCTADGWCETFCFDGQGCYCDMGEHDHCVGAKPNPNAGDDRRVVDETDTVGASAEDPPPGGPPDRGTAAETGVGAAEAEPARTPVPEATE